MARVLQHEIDHLDGILFLDRLTGPDKLHKLPDKEKAQDETGMVA
jgi:peptide deformylase